MPILTKILLDIPDDIQLYNACIASKKIRDICQDTEELRKRIGKRFEREVVPGSFIGWEMKPMTKSSLHDVLTHEYGAFARWRNESGDYDRVPTFDEFALAWENLGGTKDSRSDKMVPLLVQEFFDKGLMKYSSKYDVDYDRFINRLGESQYSKLPSKNEFIARYISQDSRKYRPNQPEVARMDRVIKSFVEKGMIVPDGDAIQKAYTKLLLLMGPQEYFSKIPTLAQFTKAWNVNPPEWFPNQTEEQQFKSLLSGLFRIFEYIQFKSELYNDVSKTMRIDGNYPNWWQRMFELYESNPDKYSGPDAKEKLAKAITASPYHPLYM